MSEIPRRIDLQRMVPAERAIYDAAQAVEAMPADVRLTDAVVLLGQARERVADFVDGVPPVKSDIDEQALALADLRRIGQALGIFAGAKPYSAHEYVERDVLPAIERLRAALPAERPETPALSTAALERQWLCRFCSKEASAIVATPEGCFCHTGDRVQLVCEQHHVKVLESAGVYTIWPKDPPSSRDLATAPTAGTCKTCKYWAVAAGGSFGVCRNDDFPCPDNGDRMATDPTFGCTLYAPVDAPAARPEKETDG